MANISRSTLSKIETSDSPYTQRTLEAMASALRCKPYDLLRPYVPEEQKTPEAALRAAMLAYGVDSSDLERAVLIIRTFVAPEAVAQSEQTPPGDLPQPASHRRASTP